MYDEIKATLQEVELFQNLSDDHLAQVATICQTRICRNGEVIFDQGSQGDALYIVGQGQVEVRLKQASGQSAAAIYLGSGQVFGEMALVDHGQRSASIVVAEDNTRLYVITTDAFNQLCTLDSGIGFLVMRNIARDLSFKLRHHDYSPSST